MAAQVDAVGTRMGGAEEDLVCRLGAHVERRLDVLDARLERLTRIVEAATEPEPEGEVATVDARLAGISARLDGLLSDVARLVGIAERVDDAG